jgi:hypothetical protein
MVLTRWSVVHYHFVNRRRWLNAVTAMVEERSRSGPVAVARCHRVHTIDHGSAATSCQCGVACPKTSSSAGAGFSLMGPRSTAVGDMDRPAIGLTAALFPLASRCTEVRPIPNRLAVPACLSPAGIGFSRDFPIDVPLPERIVKKPVTRILSLPLIS